jgi:hypothetical protein
MISSAPTRVYVLYIHTYMHTLVYAHPCTNPYSISISFSPGIQVEDYSLPLGCSDRHFFVRSILLGVGGDWPATRKMFCCNLQRCHWCMEGGVHRRDLKRKAYGNFRRQLRMAISCPTLMTRLVISSLSILTTFICFHICGGSNVPSSSRTRGARGASRPVRPPHAQAVGPGYARICGMDRVVLSHVRARVACLLRLHMPANIVC